MSAETGKSLTPFTFEDQQIRIQTDEQGNPWFVAADVCAVLEIVNVGNVLARLDDDEKDDIRLTDAIGRLQQTAIISESGLYNLILRSDKPQAKPFRKWVTSEVLPAIRKTGSYTTPRRSAVDHRSNAVLRANAMLKVVPGVDKVVLAHAMLDTLEETSGVDFAKMRQALPALPDPDLDGLPVVDPWEGQVMEVVGRLLEVGGIVCTVHILDALDVADKSTRANVIRLGRILRKNGFIPGTPQAVDGIRTRTWILVGGKDMKPNRK